MVENVSTFTWTCDRSKFLEVISCKNKYIEKIGLKSNFEWYFEIKLDCVPREYEIIIEKSKDEPDSPEASVSRTLSYCNYLWNFYLCRVTDHLSTNVSVKLVFGTNVVSADLSFLKGMSSQLIGTCDTTNIPDHRIDLILTFGEGHGVDLFSGVKNGTDEEKRRYDITISNKDKLCSDLIDLYYSEEGSDVTFKCGGETIKAHKCILAARSPIFYNMFTFRDNPDMVWVGDQSYHINDVKPDIFRSLLRYIYRGEISIDSRIEANQIWSAARKYKVLDLVRSLDIHSFFS